jgi:hypothetical protein
MGSLGTPFLLQLYKTQSKDRLPLAYTVLKPKPKRSFELFFNLI